MVATSDSYERVVSKIQSHRGTTISVPELSELLGVKTTTLNARFRRTQTMVQTVGRTNYVPPEIAFSLAAQHKYALMGWLTLQQASQLIGIKPGTLKAKCEKGELEGYVDLTKRLRINPSELQNVSLARTKTTKRVRKGEHSQSQPNSEPEPESYSPVPEPDLCIKVIHRADYGLPEADAAPTNGNHKPKPQPGPKKSGCLSYFPEKLFSVSECAIGKSIQYGDYYGTILKIHDDPFSPRIKVHFPGHPHPLMREVLLMVGRKKAA